MTYVRTKLQTRPQINTVGDILEKESVKELVQFERYCRDNALWEEMDRCYTADSEIIISWFHGTGHEFVEASKGWLAGLLIRFTIPRYGCMGKEPSR